MEGQKGNFQLELDSEIITLRELFDIIMLNIKLIGIVTLCFFVFGFLYATFRSPVFHADALLKIPQNSEGENSLVSKLASMGAMPSMGGMNNETATQQYILSSRSVLETAILTHHLDIQVTPWYFPLIGRLIANHYDQQLKSYQGPAKPWAFMSRYSWGGNNVVVGQFDVPEQLFKKKFTLINLGNNAYQVADSDGIILSGQLGKLSSVIYHGNPLSIQIDKITANPNTHFTIQKLPILDALKWLKGKIKVEQAGLQTNLITLQASGLPREHVQSMLQAVIDSAVTLSIQLRAEKAKKILDFIHNQLPVVQNNLSSIDNKVNTTLPMGTVFSNLEREKNIQSMVYTNMLVDVEQYALEKASFMGDIAVVMQPTPAYPKYALSNAMLTLVITFLGAILSVIFVIGRQLLTAVISDPVQIEKISGLHFLSGLQVSKMQSDQVAMFEKERLSYLKALSEIGEEDVTLEGFRSLRTGLFLNYFDEIDKPKIITINGPIPGVGKSFVSLNLAEQLAESGKRVLLIDADMRKGTICNYFESTKHHAGLHELVTGKKIASECIMHTRFVNLSFIPSGQKVIKNISSLSAVAVEKVLTELKTLFDIIVIDTAPVLAVSDALVFNRYADINLLVLSHAKHNEREIDFTINRFEKSGIKLHGFVMNFVPVPRMGYGYGYHYKYST